jgi:ubiquitin-protein ligase
LKNSILFKYFVNFIDGITLLEIENSYEIFNEIINIMVKLDNHLDIDFIHKFSKNLKPIIDQILLLSENSNINSLLSSKNTEKPYFSILDSNNIAPGGLDTTNLYKTVQDIYIKYLSIISKSEEIKDDTKNEKLPLTIDSTELYYDIMKPLQFAMSDLPAYHKFHCYHNNKLEPQALKRIISEISSFKSGLPLNYESTIWMRVSKNNINLFTFIISGPKDTPYENGLFEFHVYLPHNYPTSEPKVLLNTTGNGTVRFNPNLYHCGKVCLSLLGTWGGNESEKWNPKTSTFLQVLISIQSLILVDDPYFNEPGYERLMNTSAGKIKSEEYNNNIQIETIKWCMINMINNPPLGYEQVVLEHFKIKKQNIIEQVDKWLEKSHSKYKSKLELEINNLKKVLNKL